MFSKLSKICAAAAIVFSAALAAAPAEAKDWLRAMDRHDSAAQAAKYKPKGDNPQWNFDLGTVVNDVAWRARTASMLRNAPKPGASVRTTAPSQLADRPEPRRLQFRF